MRYFRTALLPIMALLVLSALTYLMASVISLFTTVASASANEAPEGSYDLVNIDTKG